MKPLDKHFENWKPNTEAIVVGTSPSLKHYDFGKYIDQFENVIRCNKCFQKGMFDHTGKKIDIWASTGNRRWNYWTPIHDSLVDEKSTIKEIWSRTVKLDKFFEKDEKGGKLFQGKHLSMTKKNKRESTLGDDSLRKVFGNSVPTGLMTLEHAIYRFGKITIIGHTFFLESLDKDGEWTHVDFYSEKEDEEHGKNKKRLGREWFENCVRWVQDQIDEGKIILLNPYELDNLLPPPTFTGYITVRMNSERVPNKSIAKVNGSSLINTAVKKLNQIKVIDNILVYTSDHEFQNHIQKGLRYDFVKRDEKLDGNKVTFNEILDTIIDKIKTDYLVFYSVTSPFIKVETIKDMMQKIIDKENDSSFLAQTIDGFCWYDNKPLNYDPKDVGRTQDIEPVILENSGLYIFSVKKYKKNRSRIGFNPYIKLADKIECWDIDTPEDLKIANVLGELQ